MLRHILLSLALLAQMLSPSIAAAQNDAGLGGYLCNLQTQSVTDEAEAHLRELFELAGKDWPDGDMPMEHCSHCVMPMAAVQTQITALVPATTKPLRAQIFSPYKLSYSYNATGPPLGSRAPPLSL